MEKALHTIYQEIFEYDRNIPLHAQELEKKEEEFFTLEKFEFLGSGMMKVPGYLGLPKKREHPCPLILLIGGLGDDKSSWFQEDSFVSGKQVSHSLMKAGFAVLALDANCHGERMEQIELLAPVMEKSKLPHFHRNLFIHTSIDYRRALDYVETRQEIDLSRLGAIGYSFGGMITFPLAVFESRLKAFASCVSPMHNTWGNITMPENYASGIIDPAFFMIMASEDPLFEKQKAQALFDSISSSQKLYRTLESGHQLPAEYSKFVVDWIKDIFPLDK